MTILNAKVLPKAGPNIEFAVLPARQTQMQRNLPLSPEDQNILEMKDKK